MFKVSFCPYTVRSNFSLVLYNTSSIFLINKTRLKTKFSITYLCLCMDGRPIFQKHIDYLVMPTPRSTMQRRQSISGFRLNISPLGQQQRHHVHFAPFTGHVEGCDVMFRCKVHVCTLVVEKERDLVVAIVGGDVQGGETALRCYVRVVVVLDGGNK